MFRRVHASNSQPRFRGFSTIIAERIVARTNVAVRFQFDTLSRVKHTEFARILVQGLGKVILLECELDWKRRKGVRDSVEMSTTKSLKDSFLFLLLVLPKWLIGSWFPGTDPVNWLLCKLMVSSRPLPTLM
jgi:hypothetical protein